jgi:hypothetical protein
MAGLRGLHWCDLVVRSGVGQVTAYVGRKSQGLLPGYFANVDSPK